MEKQTYGRARIVFLLWLLIAIIYFYIASGYITAMMRDDEFEDYLRFAVQLVVEQDRTSLELRQLVLAKARELEIPLDPVSVEIQGEGSNLELEVSYSVVIDIPLLREASYRREFDHRISASEP